MTKDMALILVRDARRHRDPGARLKETSLAWSVIVEGKEYKSANVLATKIQRWRHGAHRG